VEVAAFTVNAQSRDTDGTYVMQRWIANFVPFVNDNAAPEPQQFSGAEPWGGDQSRLGVYLHWQLPEALCCGHQDEKTGEIGEFPLVPNRWLVVRRSNHGVRSWVVHSDFLDRHDGAVSYLDPHADTTTATKIGRAVELTTGTGWQEPGGTPFLTALGPGLLAFSVYQPYNANVFSLHDRLDDIGGDDRQLSGRRLVLRPRERHSGRRTARRRTVRRGDATPRVVPGVHLRQSPPLAVFR
jgi:hypothetical protein